MNNNTSPPCIYMPLFCWKVIVFSTWPRLIMQALGVDLATIQSMVGHADLDMTQHYLHVQAPIKQKAIQVFDQAFCVA